MQRSRGWLRLRFRVGSSLRRQALVLRVYQYAASEVYLNGRLLRRYGELGAVGGKIIPHWPNGDPIELALSEQEEQVLAIRFAPWPPFTVFSEFLGTHVLEAP